MQRVPTSEAEARVREESEGEERGALTVGRCNCLHAWLLSLTKARPLPGVWARFYKVSHLFFCFVFFLFELLISCCVVMLTIVLIVFNFV